MNSTNRVDFNRATGESGINFFENVNNEQNSFEVNVETH